jgi:hypothetical protein
MNGYSVQEIILFKNLEMATVEFAIILTAKHYKLVNNLDLISTIFLNYP